MNKNRNTVIVIIDCYLLSCISSCLLREFREIVQIFTQDFHMNLIHNWITEIRNVMSRSKLLCFKVDSEDL